MTRPTDPERSLRTSATCLLYLVSLVLYLGAIVAWLVAPAWLLGRMWPGWIAVPLGLAVSVATGWWLASRIVLSGGIGGSNPLRRPPGRRTAPPPGTSGAPPTRSMHEPLARRKLDDPP